MHMRLRGTQEAYKEKPRKMNQQTFFFFFIREPYVLFYWFLNVFDRFRPSEIMRKHAFAGRNTQHLWKVDNI